MPFKTMIQNPLFSGAMGERKGMDFCILRAVLEEYYNNLFDGLQMNEEPLQEQGIIPDGCKVSPEEIAILIKKLKPGKAPGSDLVTSEVLCCAIGWWAQFLEPTFTLINTLGKMPRSWNQAIIVTVH